MGFLLLVSILSFIGLSELMMLDHKINHGISLIPSVSPPNYVFLNDSNESSINYTGKLQRKIVNGKAATRGQFCYQVYLQFTDGKSYWSCGGSLVTTRVVLTAAHCVQGAVSATAALGALDLSQYEFGRIVTSVSRSGLRVHENYDENNIYNDIGVVTLSKAITLNNYICTVKVPTCSTNATDNTKKMNTNQYTVSGWGKTTDSSLTYRLMYVNLSGESQSSCAAFYKRRASYTLIQSQMCTSGEAGKSTCNGDSGGPLVQTDTSGTVVQQGIVSLGLSSCQLCAASVYTKLSSFMPWLCPLINQ